ncbi:MAG: hypothetical protein ACRC0S_02040 [Fusobacteriaceae bacterium]
MIKIKEEKDTTTNKTNQFKKEVAETKSTKIYVYIGETVANHKINITKNSIVNNLDKYKKLFTEITGMKDLFVEINKYSTIKNKMKEINSPINKKIKEVSMKLREVTNV